MEMKFLNNQNNEVLSFNELVQMYKLPGLDFKKKHLDKYLKKSKEFDKKLFEVIKINLENFDSLDKDLKKDYLKFGYLFFKDSKDFSNLLNKIIFKKDEDLNLKLIAFNFVRFLKDEEKINLTKEFLNYFNNFSVEVKKIENLVEQSLYYSQFAFLRNIFLENFYFLTPKDIKKREIFENLILNNLYLQTKEEFLKKKIINLAYKFLDYNFDFLIDEALKKEDYISVIKQLQYFKNIDKKEEIISLIFKKVNLIELVYYSDQIINVLNSFDKNVRDFYSRKIFDYFKETKRLEILAKFLPLISKLEEWQEIRKFIFKFILENIESCKQSKNYNYFLEFKESFNYFSSDEKKELLKKIEEDYSFMSFLLNSIPEIKKEIFDLQEKKLFIDFFKKFYNCFFDEDFYLYLKEKNFVEKEEFLNLYFQYFEKYINENKDNYNSLVFFINFLRHFDDEKKNKFFWLIFNNFSKEQLEKIKSDLKKNVEYFNDFIISFKDHKKRKEIKEFFNIEFLDEILDKEKLKEFAQSSNLILKAARREKNYFDNSPLEEVKERFFRKKLKKVGIDNIFYILDKVPGFDDDRTLKEKIILRGIDVYSFYLWKKIYENYKVFRKNNFNYIPIEPIIYFDPYFENNLVLVYSGVLGPTIEEWFKKTSLYKNEIEEQKNKILNILKEEFKIDHHHPHNLNFCLYFERDKNGEVDLTKVPRVYLIDFDMAEIIVDDDI